MAEIYRGSSNTVYLNIEGAVADVPPTAVAYFTHDPETTFDLTVETEGIDDDTEVWSAVLSFALTQEVGEVVVRWDFAIGDTDGYKIDYFDVVVPLVELDDIRDELELPDSTTDDELVLAERRVRRIIENATNQQFAPLNKTYTLNTTSGSHIRLPQRLLSISAISANGFPFSSMLGVISPDGWQLRKVKQYYPGSIIKTGGVIDDPYSQLSTYWRGGGYVVITGKWGWERVPAPIHEAALILLEDRLCPESAYRDRYIETMTAADWRFQFAPGAYVNTGNVVADKILAEFKASNMAVL